jgi:hypothetical protein
MAIGITSGWNRPFAGFCPLRLRGIESFYFACQRTSPFYAVLTISVRALLSFCHPNRSRALCGGAEGYRFLRALSDSLFILSTLLPYIKN